MHFLIIPEISCFNSCVTDGCIWIAVCCRIKSDGIRQSSSIKTYYIRCNNVLDIQVIDLTIFKFYLITIKIDFITWPSQFFDVSSSECNISQMPISIRKSYTIGATGIIQYDLAIIECRRLVGALVSIYIPDLIQILCI